MIRPRGYPGSVTQLRRVVAELRPPRCEAFLRLRTFPGEQAQADWAHFGEVAIGRARRRLSGFVLTLSYSRALWLEFFMDQSLENFLLGHVHAFHDWGGAPRSVETDNLRSVVLERRGDAIHFHPRFLELSVHYGFVTDYLAEAFRALRKQNLFDEAERAFRFGSHVEGRDATAVKKTVSGLLKILHPGGGWTKEELTECVELALEGRRRIKEQLKKRGSFEFYKTSFSYIDLADDTERSVSVPEQGGAGVISQDPLPPGTVYTAAVDSEAKVALFRLEVTLTAGTGKLRIPTGLEKSLKESLNRAFSYLQSVKDKLGLTQILAQKDIYAEAVDLSGGRIDCPCGVAFFAAIISVIRNRHVQAGTVILGDLTIQGNIKGPASITEPLQLAIEAGALRVLVPVSNKAQFAGLPEDVIERLDVVFYGDVDRAVLKTLEI
jgi:ATP-dependent Lon protease